MKSNTTNSELRWVKASERLPDKCGEENGVVIVNNNPERYFATLAFRNFDKENPRLCFTLGNKFFITTAGEPDYHTTFPIKHICWLEELPVTKEGAEKDIYHSLLSNSLRLLSDEQRAGLIAALFVRSSNWDYIVSEINRTNEVEGRKIYVTGDKSLIEHSCDAPLKTCAAIEQEDEFALHHIISEAADYMGRMVSRLKKSDPHYPYLPNAREAAFKLNRVLDVLKLNTKPNWYVLYEGLCGSHMELRSKYRNIQEENQILRRELKDWKQKCNDAIDRLNNVQNVAVSDTTGSDSSNEDGNIKIDWERIEEEAKKKFYWNYNSEWINWLKTNLPKYIK